VLTCVDCHLCLSDNAPAVEDAACPLHWGCCGCRYIQGMSSVRASHTTGPPYMFHWLTSTRTLVL